MSECVSEWVIAVLEPRMVALNDAVDDVTLVVGHEQAHPYVQQQADHRDCDVVPVRPAKPDRPPGVRRGLHFLDIFEAFVAADLALGFGDILFQEALDTAIKVAGFAAVPGSGEIKIKWRMCV